VRLFSPHQLSLIGAFSYQISLLIQLTDDPAFPFNPENKDFSTVGVAAGSLTLSLVPDALIGRLLSLTPDADFMCTDCEEISDVWC
jgi:hypothetical protein